MTTTDNSQRSPGISEFEAPDHTPQKTQQRALDVLPSLLIIGAVIAVVATVTALGVAFKEGYFYRRSIPEERAIQGSAIVPQLLAAGISRVQRVNSSFGVEAVDTGKLYRGVCAWNQRADPAQDFASDYCKSSDRYGYDYILDLTEPNIVYRGDSLSEDVSKADFLAWMALDAQLAIEMVEKARQERLRQESEQRAWAESASFSDQPSSTP